MKTNTLRTFRSLFTVLILAIVYCAPAFAGGMAEDDANNFLSWVKVIVPVIFVVSLIVLGLAYSKKLIDKGGLINWFIGLFLSASAGELVALLWHN